MSENRGHAYKKMLSHKELLLCFENGMQNRLGLAMQCSESTTELACNCG